MLGQRLAMGAAFVLAVAAIGRVRAPLADSVRRVKEASDVYALPEPAMLPVVTLGYRSAAADLLWAYVLVTQGTHMSERRRFDHGARYFESIFALEPTYREPYLLVDAILTFGAVRATIDDVREARRLLEFGVAQRRTDAQLHYQAGSFIAYIAPSYLSDADTAEWQIAGARLIARAAELGLGATSTREALAGASLLNKNGQREAAASVLERSYELTEDPAQRAEILRRLAQIRGEAASERAKNVVRRFEGAWRSELPFVSRTRILVLGPPTDTFACTGPRERITPSCARDWRTWAELASER